jgi:hypothetical protein
MLALYAQALTAFSAPAAQNLPAAFCFHARPESDPFFSSSFVWLKSSF